ncbi:MAG: sugar phosphate isomerase/epimerase [Clostridia bacterium]|nr:sugar phosphate isomerase/epimerase [Clostridia bacterium]
MRFGMCMGIESPERVKMIADAGFDYVECGFCSLSRADDSVFEAFKDALNENNIKCEAANGFLPKDLPIINGDLDAIASYIENGMKRGAEIGLKKIAFGSSKARNVPDGVSYAEGFRQLGEFLKNVVSPLAEKYGITIVTEPLRKDECNIINTIKEGTMLAVLSGKENISCLADIYHMIGEGDTLEDVKQLKGSLKHAHICNPVSKKGLKRDFPQDNAEFDYKAYVDALEFAGCDTCSVEAQCIDFESETLLAGKLLKSL